MGKLLVPFDGSENAARALRYAARLVRDGGASEIRLVHVNEEPWVYGEIAVYVPRERMTELQRAHSRAILESGAAILSEAGVPFTTETLVGPIGPTLARRAEELGCAAIVMGTRGMTPIGGLLMGSVATKVVHSVAVPVTLVK